MTRIAPWLAVPIRWYLGALFVGASLHKIAAPHEFALDIATYAILPLSLVNPLAVVLPWIELVAGVMLLLGIRVKTGALLVTAMMVVFIAALGIALARGLDMSCGCFASQGAESDPISRLTMLRDLLWLGMSLFVLCCDEGFLGVERFLERRLAHA